MKPNVKFTVKDLDRELIVEMLKRFTLYEISVKFEVKYSDLVNRCINMRVSEIELPENDRFAKADEICQKKGFANALEYIREKGVDEFRIKIKPLIC